MEDFLSRLMGSRGAGGMALFSGGGSNIAEALSSNDDNTVMGGLQQLCEQLNMSSVMPMFRMNAAAIIPSIIKCLQRNDYPDMNLLAARVLTYMADSFPPAVVTLAEPENVDALLSHLRVMEDIELSEQCLTCIEKICESTVGSLSILQGDGIAAMLTFADFFTITSQRKIWSNTARICVGVNAGTFHFVRDVLPTLRAGLRSEDAAVRCKAIMAMKSILYGVRDDRDLVDEAFGDLSTTLLPILLSQEKDAASFLAALSLIQIGVRCSDKVALKVVSHELITALLTLLHDATSTEGSAAAAGGAQGRQAASPATQNTSSFGDHPTGSPASDSGHILSTLTRDRRFNLSLEETRVLSSIFTALLPCVQEGNMVHLDSLRAKELKIPEDGKPFSPGDGDDDDDDDDDDDEDEDNQNDDDDDDEDEFEDVSDEEQEEERNPPSSGRPGTAPEDGSEEEEGEFARRTHRFFHHGGRGGRGTRNGNGGTVRNSAAEAERLRHRIHEAGVQLNTQVEHRRLKNHNCICDECDRTLTLSNWYHCNRCPNFDLCGSCLLSTYRSHYDGHHAFTDMNELAKHKITLADAPREEVEKGKVNFYKSSPRLLSIVLRAVPGAVRLSSETEAPLIRYYCVDFLTRALHIANTQQLLDCGITQTPICETISTTFQNPYLLTYLGVFIAQKLNEKVPKVYQELLVREGITHSLQKLKTSLSTAAKRQRAAPEMLSVAWWKSVIAEMITALLATFPNGKAKERTKTLQKVCRYLREGKSLEAFVLLRDVLLSDVTTFEFISVNFVHDLKEAFTKSHAIDDIVAFVHILSSASCASPLDGNSASTKSGSGAKIGLDSPAAAATTAAAAASHFHNTPFLKLVRHLQGILTYLDDFEAPKFGTVESTQSKINIRLVPDTMMRPERHAGPTPGSSAAARRAELGDLLDGLEGGPHGARQSANVAVEPLADISTIGVFVAQKLLHVVRSERHPRNAQTAEEEEEEQADEPSSVWLRYNTKVLPPSMTMVQLIQMLEDEKSKGKKGSETAGNDNSGNSNGGGRGRGGKRNAKRGADSHRRGLVRGTVLHYSEVPYTGPGFEFISVAPKIPSSGEVAGSASAPIAVLLPSQDCYPSAAGEVLRKLNRTFPWSDRFLNDAQREVLTLLSLLNEVTLHWTEVAVSPITEGVAARLARVKGVPPVATGCQGLELASPSPAVNPSEFCHQKLNNKAMRHCSNFLLAGQHLRAWAVNLALDCGFLFFPTTRKFLFDISFCGTIRSMVRMQQKIGDYGVLDRSSADHNMSRSFRLRRVKKRVWRDLPMQFALKFLGGPRTSGSVAWEFEFFGEVGLGSGPTKEFYTLVAEALRERKLNLWRASDESEQQQHFIPIHGLYPRICSFGASEDPKTVEEMEKYFLVVGRFIARALLDDHVPALYLSPALLRLLRGDCCTVEDLRWVDDSVYRLVHAILAAHRNGTNLIQMAGQSKAYPIEAMGLDFSMTGVSLLPQGNGEEMEVTAENMLAYCDAIVETVLQRGVEKAVVALRRGFDDYIPLYALQMLSVEELQEVIKGHDRLVTRQEFMDHCLADHGYTLSSRPVQWLFDILSSFTVEEQKSFFLFLTGSVNLPIGGLASLHPKLTIVRKTSSEPNVKESDQLPSAMTCQNYLKLPAYESMEQMRSKIRQAMEEGKGSFHLT